MRNEIKVGILGVVTLTLLIFGYKYLKGSNLLDRSKTYYVKYPDVGQMDPSSPVLTRGFKVGTVTKIELDPTNPKLVLVTIDVKNEIKIPKETKAILVSQGLIGGKAIVLQFNEYCDTDCLPNKSLIEGEIAGMLSSMFSKDEVKDYTQTIGKELNTLLDTSSTNQNVQLAATVRNVHTILDNLAKSTIQLNHLLTNSAQNINNSLVNLNQLTSSLSKNANSISNSLNNLEAISNSLKLSEPGKLVKSAEQTITESRKTIQELNLTLDASRKTVQKLNNILTEVNSGNGSLGKLIKDPTLYQNLNRSSKNLDLLLQDLRLNPTRYINVSVFGKKGTSYTAPVEDPTMIK
ncbi:MAG: MCE family protein [Saprospiraceae bacterium]|nr:MCE family protein [Saprospiraceae bacterium]